MLKRVSTALLVLALFAPSLWADKPALVVYIVVDQLRGDLPIQYLDRFGEKGFRRFFDHGTAYTNAHYRHAVTFTGPGHATLATGGNPREHGIIANDWADVATGKPMYCAQDESHKILDAQTAAGAGTSPKNLLMPTLGDALVEASGGQSRAFGVSGKDRGAILMAGHLGKAFWFSNATGGFVTSDYYYPAYPGWVAAYNSPAPADAYAGKIWDLLRPETEYVNPDQREAELPNAVIGGVFPHSLEGVEARKLYGTISVTPFSDELTIAFAKALVQNEQLGQRGATDLLTVSLSATDIIGHQFGPESREQEDNLLRLDALLAEFIDYLEASVGKDKLLVALSADHGVDGNPGGKPTGQLDPALVAAAAKDALKAKFGADQEYIQVFNDPYLNFTPALIAARPADIAAMEDIAAAAILKVPGVAYAVPAHTIIAGELDAENPIMEMIARAFRPGVSGNVYVVQDAYHRVFSGKAPMTATHGTPYSYDTHVPILFYGAGIAAQRIDSKGAGPEDIAPTLAALLGIAAPAGASGQVLKEVKFVTAAR